jgi:hypothetical protein
LAFGCHHGKFFRKADRASSKVIEWVEPFVRRAVLKLYGEDASGLICPGEADCERWASTKAKNRADKETKACHPCHLYPTKTDRYKKRRKSLEWLTNSAFEARQRRNSGYPFENWQILSIQFETLLLVDALCEAQDLGYRHKILESLKVGFGLKEQ